MCVSLSGERIEPATPIPPEETQKEDAKETLKESKGVYRTYLGKTDNVTPLITNYPCYLPYFVLPIAP
jgi:hypothetical protein